VQTRLQDAQKEADVQKLKKVRSTDPESRFMKNKKRRIELTYNPQITVDKKGFVLANDFAKTALERLNTE